MLLHTFLLTTDRHGTVRDGWKSLGLTAAA